MLYNADDAQLLDLPGYGEPFNCVQMIVPTSPGVPDMLDLPEYGQPFSFFPPGGYVPPVPDVFVPIFMWFMEED